MPFPLSRHVVYPLQEKVFHRPTFSYLAQLEKSQWLSRVDLERLQMEKLRALLEVAHQVTVVGWIAALEGHAARGVAPLPGDQVLERGGRHRRLIDLARHGPECSGTPCPTAHGFVPFRT